jgi:hypothetical protein
MGALPLVSLIVAVVVECWSLIIGCVEEVNDSAMVFFVVESRACGATILRGCGLTLYVGERNE